MEMQMTRRFALELLALGGGTVGSQTVARELVLALGRESVPITDAGGRIAYRFPSFNAIVRVDIGEDQFMQLCCIPGGVGMMGSARQWNELGIRSTPVHPVRVGGFLLGRYEVTQGQWLRVSRLPQVNRELFVGYRLPRTPEEASWPVEAISSLQAEEFCDRLARFTGLRCRLPSESEWEYACRAGTSTVYHFGDSFGASVLDSEVMSGVRFQPVGIKNAPNRYGLHDMHGGVGDWCSDWSHPDYVGAPADGSPWMSSRGDSSLRIVRGAYDRMGSAGGTTS
jgi:formylglycine-generating enzyme required for sulfatase activity